MSEGGGEVPRNPHAKVKLQRNRMHSISVDDELGTWRKEPTKPQALGDTKDGANIFRPSAFSRALELARQGTISPDLRGRLRRSIRSLVADAPPADPTRKKG